MNRRDLLSTALAAGAATAFPAIAQTSRAICYNCPPEWADWGGMLRLVGQRLSIQVPPDNKNSGQSLAALIAEKAKPVADVVYLGGQVGPQAKAANVLDAYMPKRFAEIPANLKDAEGYCCLLYTSPSPRD